MSDFVDEEAEVSEGEESGSGGEDAPKRKNLIDSSEEDEDGLDENLEDLIDDNPVEEEPDDEEDDGEGKRKKEESESDDSELEDEDYALIKENLGYEVKRKRKRLRRMSSDESDMEEGEPEADRDKIAGEIFDDGDEAEETTREPEAQADQYAELDESSDEEDVDDFIVDEDGQPVSRGKKKRKHIHTDAALQEAQDIFGVDYDFDEFDEYGESSAEESEEDYMDEDEEGVERPKTKKSKKRGAKKTIFEVFEPSELEQGHFTDLDQEIRMADMPERFQLRGIPVRPTEEGELMDEARWIYKYAFSKGTVSIQDGDEHSAGFQSYGGRHDESTVNKIREALNFMRNQQFEVPFIAFYRKEYVEPELNINDLWKVWHWDEKWTQLRTRKENLVRLFERMQQYQFEMNSDPEKPLDSRTRPLTDEDVHRANDVETMDELKDVYQHFLLYYGCDIPKMKNLIRPKKKKIVRRKKKKDVEEVNEGDEKEKEEGDGGEQEKPEGEEDGEENGRGISSQPSEDEWEEVEVEEEDDSHVEALKQASRKTGYTLCENAGLHEVAKKFGLVPEKCGENLRDNYQRHEPTQHDQEPLEVAREYISSQFPTEEDVLKGARHMVAMQIAHEPVLRNSVRDAFIERATITCSPTKKGQKEIDENHPCYTIKYLKNKPIRKLLGDQFLKIHRAQEDSLMNYEISMDGKGERQVQTYLEEIKQLFQRDEFSHLVQEWNNQRFLALERAVNMILYPQMIKDLKAKLLEESKAGIIKAASRRLYNWLKVAPYQADQQLDDDDYDDASKGLKVMGLAYSTERDTAAFCAIVDGEGAVTDFQRLEHIMKRKNAWRIEDRQAKESDLEGLKGLISMKAPHVIVVGGEDREALNLVEDIKQLVAELEQEKQMAPINVELMDTELSILYSYTKKAQHDFREYPPKLRQAISLARRMQDPLIEFAQLCNSDEEILGLKYHPMQDAVSKEELLNGLYLEFINRVNEVGVDVNRCVAQPHTAPLIQFVCGLGPRKGSHLLKILKQGNSRLENRTQLVTQCKMGPKVFFNCAGFIKIDTSSLGDSTDAYVEVLDGSRVHPETYEWARKMAVDALEYDESAVDANPAGALEEILESPERLKDLDLDAFAVELERQGYGNKHITLYDIRAELNHRYKDLRTPYTSPTTEERFNMLTKETPQTFYIGKLIMCQVTGIARKRPQGDLLDQANPVRDDNTGLWKCPFCLKDDFPELSEVWSHFDAGSCPGSAVGVKTRVDNGVSGFISNRNLSEKKVTNPEERVKIGMILHARIVKIDIERFQVDLTTKSSDLADKEGKWGLPKDTFYDFETEVDDNVKEEEKKKQQARQTYIKRVIVHPSFHNIDYKKCEKLMQGMDLGEVIIRPSSKGSDHLTVTWKVTSGVCQHIDVREEGKENVFSLGKSLWIGSEEFEDLDEIIARYIQPMAAFARDLLNYKYFKDCEGKIEMIDVVLKDEKKRQPSRIPYYFTASKDYPGKFVLAYLPRKDPKHEYVSVTPDGFRYRGQMFSSVNSLVRWFKEHFRDPVPGTPHSTRSPMPGRMPGVSGTPRAGLEVGRTPAGRTPAGRTPSRTPAGLPGVFGTLVSGQTPQLQPQGGGFRQGLTPGFSFPQVVGGTPMVTPSMMTPSLQAGIANTPAQSGSGATPRHVMATPVAMATPSYQATPRQNWNQPGATPNRTPAYRTPRQMPGGNAASMDWGKVAQQWMKEKEKGKGDRRRSRPSQSPAPDRGVGDATPLIDE